VIRDDYLVNDDLIGGGTHQMPECAFDSLGNCVVAWEDFRNGNADPIAQRYDFNGSRIGVNFRPCDDGDMWWHGEPAAGMARGGDFIVVWEDRRHANSDVMAQRYVGGLPVDTNFQVNDPSGSDQRGATVTVRRDNSVVAAWEDWRRNNGAIYAQVLDSEGLPIGPNFWVNSSGAWQAYGASIGSDDARDFAIAWEDARAGWDVWCQRYDSLAQPQGSNFQVNSITNPTYNLPTPSLAMFADGRFLVTWTDYRDDSLHGNVYCQRYDPQGQSQGANFRVNDLLPGSDHYSPCVAVDPQGNFLVVWSDNRGGRAEIYGQGFDPAGTRLGGNFKINDNAQAIDQGSPFVRFSPADEYWALWTDLREGRPNIYGQRLTADRNPIGGNFRINDDSFSSQQRVPSVVANRQGRTLTIWEDERNGNCDVYCQFSDSLGNPNGPNRRVNDDNIGAAHYYATAAIDEIGNSITAWTDSRSGYNIYGQSFDPAGNPIGANFRVNSAAAFVWAPTAAKDSIGNSVIVFSDMRAGPFKMFGQRYDAANQPVGANFRIDNDTTGGWLQYPSVAMSHHGRFVAGWMDERQGGSIYARLYDSIGNPTGDDFRVDDDPGRNYKGYPGVAMTGAGDFLAVWEDGRESLHVTIYGQRFDRNGNRVGSNFRVPDDPTASDQWCPSCAFDPQDRAIVVWSDWRDPRRNPDIYAQRYNETGAPVGGNRLVNQPSHFYYNHHWTMQRSVAAWENRLIFTWTENRRHRGWDNYNKITDWEIVPITEDRVGRRTSQELVLNTWPNPASAFIRVYLRVQSALISGSGKVQVSAFSVSGRKVLKLYDGVPAGSELALRFSLASLSPGTYFLVARSESATACRKLVIR
jgi:hypothetical protein